MAISNSERIGRALELVNEGLRPFIFREMESARGDGWIGIAAQGLRDERAQGADPDEWDTHALISVILDQWGSVFRQVLGPAERTWIHELKDIRNRWAHQDGFSSDDAYRALDTMYRLLSALSAPEAQEIDRQKTELMRQRFAEQARREQRKAASSAIEGQPASGYKPWREVVTPHPDVAGGLYHQAEFAADLAQVHRGEGVDEYREPRAFFARTYITEGIRDLLTTSLRRLSGSGGDPVVELQTNFGGGKTHSMLALYHALSGVPSTELPGMDAVVDHAGGVKPVKANRAVLVGTAISPAQVQEKPDGTKVHTLWGEMAWQLLGTEGYALVAEDDQRGVSPGSGALKTLFDKAAPCIVLIDEWVAFLRNIYKVDGLPAGSFEANLTFAQALTEAVKAADRAQVVASIPASQIEIGGEGGQEALRRIEHTFGRLESAWRPASTEESFEIVRRRLFQPIQADAYPARDAVVKAFADMYRAQSDEFPGACREGDYRRRLEAAYPIHPELFDQLFGTWSTLDRFQRTRGVLRLMAMVIHALWEQQDGSLLILPSSVPVSAASVLPELRQYLPENWAPIVERDVDGPQSLPLEIDRSTPNLGRYSASRRVARTVFMGTAPAQGVANKGLDERHIKLGCVQPGEAVATFGDALRRLAEKATYLYVDGSRYWYSTQPSVNRLARDRSAQYSTEEVHEEIRRRLRDAARDRGEFARVHPVPTGPGDVADEREARLVLLPPERAHAREDEASEALQAARQILESKGTGPRRHRNALVFLAADRTRLEDLEQAVRKKLAWQSIAAEWEALGLDAFQKNQAETQRDRAEEAVRAQVPETFTWALVPQMATPDPEAGTGGPPEVEWEEIRIQGADSVAARVSKRLRNDDLLITVLAGTVLRMHLDRVPLWRGDHVRLQELSDFFGQYLYLPRLRDDDVLIAAVEDGISQLSWNPETFAYADSYDESAERYVGLRAGHAGTVTLSGSSMLVRPEVAAAQLAEEGREQEPGPGPEPAPGPEPEPEPEKGARRFYGSVEIDPSRLGRDAAQIAAEVVAHLAGLMNSSVRVTLEIEADLAEPAPENVVRTVTENCRTLKFNSHAFEEE